MCKTYYFKAMYNIDYFGHITLFDLSVNFLFTNHVRVLVSELKCSDPKVKAFLQNLAF